MFKHNKQYGVLFVTVFLVLLFVAGCASQQGASPDTTTKEIESEKTSPEKTRFVLGSGTDGSYGYLCLEAMSSVLNKHIDLKFSSVATNGGAENIALLFNNDIDAGHSNNADILLAYNGEEPFKEPLKPMQLLSYGVVTEFAAVRADSDINSIYDLEGKTVIVGPAGSGLETDVKTYFGLAGIKHKPVYLSPAETGDAFIAGRADAAMLLFRNGQPYPMVLEVEAAMDIKYLPWDPEINKKMMDLTATTLGFITPDASPFITEPMDAFMNPMILVTRPDLDEELAYTITKTLVENVEELIAITPHLQMVSKENVTKGLIANFPVHPGAVRYYKEAGIWEDRLTEG